MVEQELVEKELVEQELVDVLDGDGNVIGVATRAEMRSQRLRHRSTAVVVRDRAGRVLVHRRSGTKDLWPGMWDLACGGVVQSGEDWDAAAARELAEEVGIVGAVLDLVAEASFDDDDVAELARLYTATWDGPVRFEDGEVVEARWVTVDELAALMVAERFVPDSLALVVPLVLGG